MALAEWLEREAQADDRRAASLSELAVELAAEAAVVAAALGGVARGFGPDVWAGPAAQRAYEETAAGTRRLRSAANDVERIAALVRRRADEHGARALGLRRHAAGVRAAGVEGVAPPPPPPFGRGPR